MKLARCGWMALLLVGACDGDEGTVTPSSVPPPSAPAPPSTANVMVGPNGQNRFDPQTVTVIAGGTVTWHFMSGAHTVTSGAPGTVDGKFCSLRNGTPHPVTCDSTSYARSSGTYLHTFATTGTYPYFCTVHGAMMAGTVVVAGAGFGGY
jgi:plastocyanin